MKPISAPYQSDDVVGIITARYASTRFPGKPLVDIGGKTMVQRTWEQACKADFAKVIVATDDHRIADHVRGFGGLTVMTSSGHNTGTERCIEVAELFNDYNNFINIQGDEPFVSEETLNIVIHALSDKYYYNAVVTPAISINDDFQINSPNTVKVVFDNNFKAMYFSRLPIPYVRTKTDIVPSYYKHLGIYGFTSATLKAIKKLNHSKYADVEMLEQLKWLENGVKIQLVGTEYDSDGIDTPEDLEKAIKKYNL